MAGKNCRMATQRQYSTTRWESLPGTGSGTRKTLRCGCLRRRYHRPDKNDNYEAGNRRNVQPRLRQLTSLLHRNTTCQPELRTAIPAEGLTAQSDQVCRIRSSQKPLALSLEAENQQNKCGSQNWRWTLTHQLFRKKCKNMLVGCEASLRFR